MPPLKLWQIIPVPPPTLPSATGPPRAPSSAAIACSAFTWKPLMSLSTPSQVSATTGRPQGCRPGRDACHCRIASRTTPTLCVFVIAIGPSRKPLSWSHVVPVISPLPLSVNQAPNTGSALVLAARVDHGDARAHRALAGDEPPLARDERRVADLDARDVGDRVERAGRAADERHEAELARPRLLGGGRRLWTERDRGEHRRMRAS